MSAGAPRAVVVALVALAGLWAVGVAATWWVTDDAYISFRYALQLVRGHGLVFNVGESPPVEGYSNLGWVLLAAGSLAMGVPPEMLMPAISAACGFALIVGTGWILRVLEGSWRAVVAAVAAVALAPSFIVWSTGGLATMPAATAFAAMASAWLLGRGERAMGVGAAAGIGLVLLRTEGVGWVAVVGLLALWSRPGQRRRLAVALVAALAAFAATLAFRVAYHQAWASNTAVAKLSWSTEHLARGASYVLGQLADDPARALLGALGIAGWLSRRDRVGVSAALLVVAPWVYAVVVSGDFMAFGRLMVPSVALVAVGVGLAVDRWPRAWIVASLGVALGVLPLADLHLVPRGVRVALDVRHNLGTYRSEAEQWAFMARNARRWGELGRALEQVAEPGDTLVVGAVGALGYHAPDLVLLDRFGLVTPAVARAGGHGVAHSPGHDRAVPITHFLAQEPTFLDAELVRGPAGMRALRRTVKRRWRTLAPERYAPELHRVQVDGRPMTLAVLARTEDAVSGWAAWEGPHRGRGGVEGGDRSAPPEPDAAQGADSGS